VIRLHSAFTLTSETLVIDAHPHGRDSPGGLL
jgi:hypothetical protein